MLGLVVLFIIGVYLAVSTLVVWLVARWAKKRGHRGWVWGGLAAFAMYNLVFWDLIPTLAMHKYYCATEAGFWVYKTPEQWAKENPGVMETLSMSHLPEEYRVNPNNGNYGDSVYELPNGTRIVAKYNGRRELMFVDFIKADGTRGEWLNERIGSTKKEDKLPLGIRQFTYVLFDFKTGEPIAKSISFGCACRFSLVGSGCEKGIHRGIGTWLFLWKCSCKKEYGSLFYQYKRKFIGGK